MMVSYISAIELSSPKPGERRRVVPETVKIIKQQINLACEGIAYKVSDLQTETGVKDRTAQYWIDRALERSSELMRQRSHEPETQDPRLKGKLDPDERKRIKEIVRSEVAVEVSRWVIEQPPERFKELPQDSRKCSALSALGISTRICLEQPFARNSVQEIIITSCLGSQARLFQFITQCTCSKDLKSSVYRIGSSSGFFN